MNYELVLRKMYSDKAWSITGNSYDGIAWHDDSPKPSDVELQAALPAAEAKAAAEKEIAELKGKLSATDYVALADYDKSKPDVVAQRQQWRERIRELEAI